MWFSIEANIIPLIAPAIISGMLLSFIVMLGIYGIPAVLGTPADIPVLTYTTEFEGEDFDTAISALADDEEVLLPQRPAPRMN